DNSVNDSFNWDWDSSINDSGNDHSDNSVNDSGNWDWNSSINDSFHLKVRAEIGDLNLGIL
ncbi:hypothetical protein, partial [Pseudonocardia asaccharolytica]|uniref:hypothetical protein n=1 Tax=Pseudonocardia asaccharolytica TaxID=54010 RepID=UPI001C9952F6